MPEKNYDKKRKQKTAKELVSYGDFILPPVEPRPELKDLCNKIDKFYKNYSRQHRKQKASDLIMGAFYAARPECRSNPDWISQAANSLRDVLYPLFSKQISNNNLMKLFKKYATNKSYETKIQNKDFFRTFNNLDKIYKQLSDLTHHGTELKAFSEKEYISFSESDFDQLLRNYVDILGKAFELQQIYIHAIINLIVEKKKKSRVIKDDLNLILSVNPDSRQYFFDQVDERWLKWLWKNGFLDVIKEKGREQEDVSPELNYLVRMAEKNPEIVANIIIDVPISKDYFNPEVIYNFLRICEILPAKHLVRIVPKILNDRWVELMSNYRYLDFQYEKMFQKLSSENEYESILTLAEAVLSVRKKGEIEQCSQDFLNDSPFYLSDVSQTKVFEYLISVDDNYVEKALSLATKVLGEIVLLGEKAERREVFPVNDIYHFYDVDFFSLELSEKSDLYTRDNVRELLAAIIALTKRTIEKNCLSPGFVQKLFKKYIETLPESRLIWRLRLFIMSLCPEAFQEQLKQHFSKLFEIMEGGKNHCEIISGTEYKKALKKSFGSFDSNYQREYVQNVFKYFGIHFNDENEKEFYKRDGWQILSSISEYLTEDELKNCEKIFGKKCDPSFEPEPSISKIKGGWVRPRGPITLEEFSKFNITEISQKLRKEWAPEALRNISQYEDFLNPVNAEGMGELLRADIARRLQDYVKNADLFFEKGVLDEHYTYSFFQGILDAILSDRSRATKIEWDGLISLFIKIRETGEKEAFNNLPRERNYFDGWLSTWTGVHKVMTDLIYELLNEHQLNLVIDFKKYRYSLFIIIEYLLDHPDPEPKDEEPESADINIRSPEDRSYLSSDPFTTAINSVRGRAFQALVSFVYQDGKRFANKEKEKISEDVKKLYEKVLKKENTRALMFMFGHYLPIFYFRDKNWIKELLPYIFPEEKEKGHLYLAAWEGYLANYLYEEMFFDDYFQKLYMRGLNLTRENDPKRRYFKKPDEGIANHLALSFVIYNKKFGFEHPLFNAIWQNNIELQSKFISIIGQIFISGNNAQINEILRKDSSCRKRLIKFWEWMLERHENPILFAEFGTWIDMDKEIFEPVWLVKRVKETLEKSQGLLNWDYGLTKSIVKMTKIAPKETLEIIRLYQLEGGVKRGNIRTSFIHNDEWLEAIRILNENSETKDGTLALINNLIAEGGKLFWKLKELIKDNKE